MPHKIVVLFPRHTNKIFIILFSSILYVFIIAIISQICLFFNCAYNILFAITLYLQWESSCGFMMNPPTVHGCCRAIPLQKLFFSKFKQFYFILRRSLFVFQNIQIAWFPAVFTISLFFQYKSCISQVIDCPLNRTAW